MGLTGSLVALGVMFFGWMPSPIDSTPIATAAVIGFASLGLVGVFAFRVVRRREWVSRVVSGRVSGWSVVSTAAQRPRELPFFALHPAMKPLSGALIVA